MRTAITCLLLVAISCGPGKPAARPMTMKAMESLVMGQTIDVVVQRLGPPDSTQNTFRQDGSQDGGVWWFYDGMLQESPDKPRTQAWLWITAGRVSKVDVN